MVETHDNECIFNFALGTDGRGFDKLIVRHGGLRHKYDPQEIPQTDESGNVISKNHLFMNGPEIFNFTIEAVPKLVAEVLEKNHYSMGDIDYFIFHQANKYMLDYLRKKIKIPEEKFYCNMLETGNTVSATIPIAYAESLKAGIIRQGQRVLLCGFGVGYSWGAVIVNV